MFRRIIIILIAICALAYAGIQPLKIDNTSLIEHINNKHSLAKREALPWWEKVVDFIIDFLQQTLVNIGNFGMNYKDFSHGMKDVFKNIFGIE